MNKTFHRQSGSALAVVVVVLIVALIGALGYITYNNINNKDGKDTQNSSVTDSEHASAKTKEFKAKDAHVTFSYPENWTVKETPSIDSTAEWYVTDIKVLNENGETVAILATGGQFGGACDETAPRLAASTIVSDSVSIKGVENARFGYTIIEENGKAGVTFGLGNSKNNVIKAGDESVQCPGMAINYRYIFESEAEVLHGITFGLWYGQQRTDDPNTYKTFASVDDAKKYAQSDEFTQVKAMITSLKISQ